MVCLLHCTGLLPGCNGGASRPTRTKSVPVLEFAEKYEEQNKCVAPYRGQLKVAVYVNAGLLTVHVIAGRHLRSSLNKKLCNAYVKLALTPDESKRTRCKTDVRANTNMPTFDEKFSFELLQGDYRRRLLISVWNKQSTDRHCELLGCMSFGIRHILQQKKEPIDGWYFLLHENIGKRKHLHVREHRLDESSLYMDMRGIDLPGVNHSSEDSGLDGMDKQGKNKESGTKLNLGSSVVLEAINDIQRCSTPDHNYHTSPALVIKHASNEELQALKETIEEQKAAINMLKERILTGDVIPKLHQNGQQTNTNMQMRNDNMQMRDSHLHLRESHVKSSRSCTPVRHLRSPLPIVKSERTLRPEEEEDSVDESRCPLHDHEPSCPLSGFMSSTALLDSSSSEDSSDEDDPPSPTKSMPGIPSKGQNIQLCLRRGENGGFGFTLTGSRPARVFTVLENSPAYIAGIQPQDTILTLDNHDVTQLSSDTVARVIRHCGMSMSVTLLRTDNTKGKGHTGTGSCLGARQRVEQWAGSATFGEELRNNLGTGTGKPLPPQRNSSKTSSLLKNFNDRTAVQENGSLPWQPQHGSLESRSRTSEGDSIGQSEGENETENGYLDMRAHWAYMNK